MKPILSSLSPNIQRDDAWLALKILFQPWKWREGEKEKELEEKFRHYLGAKYAFSFNSGRVAMLAILKSLVIKKGNVLLSGFTCNAAVNPIIWSNLEPKFYDIEEGFNVDFSSLKKSINKKSKVLLVQHTFGLPVNMNDIQKLATENNLVIIEDCAHALGAKWQNSLVGTFGQAAFFSFGRDKIISSVYGGIAVTNDSELADKIKSFQTKCNYPSRFWIFQQLLHPILTYYIIIPLYRFKELGRLILLILQKLRILSKSVHQKEKWGEKPSYFPRKISNALSSLAIHQLYKLEEFNKHRDKIAKIYSQELKNTVFVLPPAKKGRIYMKYSILSPTQQTDQVLRRMRNEKIILYDGWRNSPIVPMGTELKKMNYQSGSCPKAEELSRRIINLPTHINISSSQASSLIKSLKKNLVLNSPGTETI